jgi:hypothetical protein
VCVSGTKCWTNISIQTHKGDEICLHTPKNKFHSQLLHAQPPPPPQRNRYPKSNGLNPTSGIFP